MLEPPPAGWVRPGVGYRVHEILPAVTVRRIEAAVAIGKSPAFGEKPRPLNVNHCSMVTLPLAAEC